MITDRTQEDLIYAQEHLRSSIPLKGAYNYTDLNRVENKTQFLATTLGLTLTTKTNWAVGDFFTASDETRVLGNLSALCSSADVTTDYIPATMSNMNIEKANNIEYTLELIELKLRGNGTLPSEASLQSSGTQYIDTGVNPRTKFEIEAEFERVSKVDSLDFVAGWYKDSTNKIYIGMQDTAGAGKRVFGYIPAYLRTDQLSSLEQKFIVHITTEADKQTITIRNDDGILVSEEKSDTVSFTETGSLYLFAVNYNSSVFYNSAIKLYKCKIWNNGELVRDYEPFYDYAQNKACLYDNVTQTAYFNQGTGDFIYN